MSNLIFHSVSLRNFMSYGNSATTVNLDGGGTILIQGVNLDDTVNGVGANGTGKTTLISAIVYAVYGTMMGDVKLDNIVNDINKKHCVVSIKFTVDGTFWEVVRYRKMKAGAEGNYVELFKDKDNTKNLAKATMPETNKYITKLIGMPLELFIRLVVFDADEVSVFKLKAAEQREIMEHLFALTILSEKSELIKEDQKDVKEHITINETSIKHLEDNIEQYHTNISTAKSRIEQWTKTNIRDVDDYKSTKLKLNGVDLEAERQLFNDIEAASEKIGVLKSEYDDIRANIKAKKSEVTHITTTISSHERVVSTNKRNILSTNNLIEKIKTEIETLKGNKCPECDQQMPDVQPNIDTRTAKIDQHYNDMGELLSEQETAEQNITSFDDELESHAKELSTLEVDMNSLKGLMQQIEDNMVFPSVSSKENLVKIEMDREQIDSKILETESRENPHTDAYDEIVTNKPDNINYDELDALKSLLEHQKFMVKLLTDKKSFVRKHLINKRLPYLNERLTHYLTMLGLPQRVEFQNDLTPKITRRGNKMDFGNLSHGQKARVNFALSFAFRDVLEKLHHKVNVCLLDEVLDKALCDVGANSAVTMINEKSKNEGITTFVITHKRELANRFHRVMTVKLENGFSYVE